MNQQKHIIYYHYIDLFSNLKENLASHVMNNKLKKN